jgi:hypothetical protein
MPPAAPVFSPAVCCWFPAVTQRRCPLKSRLSRTWATSRCAPPPFSSIMRCSHPPAAMPPAPSASAQPALITFKTSSASAGWASFQKLRYPLALCIITVTLSNALVVVGYHLLATDAQVIGLSKFNRIVHHICERPQIQEEMTSQIADALRETVKTPHM